MYVTTICTKIIIIQGNLTIHFLVKLCKYKKTSMLLKTELMVPETAKSVIIGGAGLIIVYYIIFFILKKIGSNPKYILPLSFARRIRVPLLLFLVFIFTYSMGLSLDSITNTKQYIFRKVGSLGIIFTVSWMLIVVMKAIKNRIINKYDITQSDNLKARKIYTQFNILENIITFIIVLFGIGIALMSFDNIRQVGVSMLTSAGIAGIIIGFAAQKALATLLAGIQIAFTQPIRLDDVVIVEGEWGVIEEINLTYVVVNIWDKRRLVVPTTYFIEKPFQNWTKNSSDLMGTVFIYTDYNFPAEALRTELTNILENTSLWDGKVNVLQVTDTKKDWVELRALVSAKDSPTAWDLRVHVREKLIAFMQKNYPENLPFNRVSLESESIVKRNS